VGPKCNFQFPLVFFCFGCAYITASLTVITAMVTVFTLWSAGNAEKL
jgi:hypothetical protein